LEEAGLDYHTIPVNISAGEQFKPDFLAISPNNRMPAIVDHDVEGEPVSVFESGAILWYLAEKTGQFTPSDALGKKEVLEWLFWQTGNQGPMTGQLSHFVNYAPEAEKQGYGRERYGNEANRCMGVLESRLEGREWLVGDNYSIADMICFPWVLIAKPLQLSLDEFPNVARWRKAVKDRPAVRRGVDVGKEFRRQGPPSDEERKLLFQQTAGSVKEQTSE
jgi:GST-like protein